MRKARVDKRSRDVRARINQLNAERDRAISAVLKLEKQADQAAKAKSENIVFSLAIAAQKRYQFLNVNSKRFNLAVLNEVCAYRDYLLQIGSPFEEALSGAISEICPKYERWELKPKSRKKRK
jgi:hypothetical protein